MDPCGGCCRDPYKYLMDNDINRIKRLAGLDESFTPDVSEYSRLVEQYAHKALGAVTDVSVEFVQEAKKRGLKPSPSDSTHHIFGPDESAVITRLIELLQDAGYQT